MGVFANTVTFGSRSVRRWCAASLIVLAVLYLLTSDRFTPAPIIHDLLRGNGPASVQDKLKPAEVEQDELKSNSGTPSTTTTVAALSSQTTAINHTVALVIASLAEEDTRWARRLNTSIPDLTTVIYVVDSPTDGYEIPKNKGHEAMPYLTYIISHYDKLPDVSLFMHAHQFTWHNNDLLGSDSALIVQHMNAAKVVRDGYVNLRCHHDPGCPAHLRPASVTEKTADINRPEELYVAQAWRELFPGTEVPEVLSQPCCAQFAVSRDKLRSVPLSEYVRHRDWIVNTKLEDAVAGRVWEYVWQYLWTSQWEFCPAEHICYCDMYGACFLNNGEYMLHFAKRSKRKEMVKEWTALTKDEDGKEKQISEKDKNAAEAMLIKINVLDKELDHEKHEAFQRGKDSRLRAQTLGREWREGDGF